MKKTAKIEKRYFGYAIVNKFGEILASASELAHLPDLNFYSEDDRPLPKLTESEMLANESIKMPYQK